MSNRGQMVAWKCEEMPERENQAAKRTSERRRILDIETCGAGRGRSISGETDGKEKNACMGRGSHFFGFKRR